MRALEVLFFILAVAGYFVATRFPERVKLVAVVFVTAAITAVLQILLEGFRWQMGLAYLASISLAIAAGRDTLTQRSASHAVPAAANDRWFMPLLLVSFLMATLVPIARLPSPHGKYPVGTTTFHLVDGHRQEIYSRDVRAKRELMVQVWYPGEQSIAVRQTPVPYMPASNSLAPYLANPLFSIVASHLHLITTHSYASLPIAHDSGKFPVLIFSHGLMGGRIQNTVLCEELASHGYVVVGIDHTYDCSFAIFPQATVLTQLVQPWQADLPKIDEVGLTVRVADVEFVRDELARLDRSDALFKGRLDLERSGVFGHSFGGQTAIMVCATDKRFKAGLSLDGYTLISPDGARTPLMLMHADRPGDPYGTDYFLQKTKGPHFDLKLLKSLHANFTDLALLTPLHWCLGQSGSIEGARAVKVIDDYALSFFNCYLKNDPDDLLKGPSAAYPEIVFDRERI